MQFLYHQNGGDSKLQLGGEEFHYLFKVRRAQVGDAINMRNLRDKYLYIYIVEEVHKNYAILRLESSRENESTSDTQMLSLHLLWAVIEPKIIEKTLPMLNELNVARISFFYAQFSQAQFRLSLERMYKILIQSCQQCGRTTLMNLEVLKSFDEVCALYKPFYAFDFGGEDICSFQPPKTKQIRIMVGAEGGFSQSERAQFAHILTLKNASILRSESACVLLSSIAKLWQGQTQKGV